jgi:hypothetical protein
MQLMNIRVLPAQKDCILQVLLLLSCTADNLLADSLQALTQQSRLQRRKDTVLCSDSRPSTVCVYCGVICQLQSVAQPSTIDR